MKEQEIIKKATKALKELNLYSGDYTDIKVVKMYDNELLIEYEPELKTRYSVMFNYKLPDGRGAHTSVYVNRETNKLMQIITKSNMYEVPENLK